MGINSSILRRYDNNRHNGRAEDLKSIVTKKKKTARRVSHFHNPEWHALTPVYSSRETSNERGKTYTKKMR